MKRAAVTIPPGPLSRQSSLALTQALNDLYSVYGSIQVAAPLCKEQDFSGGTRIRMNTQAAQQLILNSNYTFIQNVTWDLSSFTWIINDTGGGGGVVFYPPVELCGGSFFCEFSYSFTVTTINNWTLPASKTTFLITPFAGGTTITGIVPLNILGVAGPALIFIINVGSDPLYFTDQDPGSSSQNRVVIPPEFTSPFKLNPKDGIWMQYDTGAQRWRIIFPTIPDNDPGFNLTVDDINPNSVTISNVSTIEIDRSSGILKLTNDGGKAEISADVQTAEFFTSNVNTLVTSSTQSTIDSMIVTTNAANQEAILIYTADILQQQTGHNCAVQINFTVNGTLINHGVFYESIHPADTVQNAAGNPIGLASQRVAMQARVVLPTSGAPGNTIAVTGAAYQNSASDALVSITNRTLTCIVTGN